MIEVLTEMKRFTQQNPEGAKRLLVENPQFAQAIVQIQVLFGLIRPADIQMLQVKKKKQTKISIYLNISAFYFHFHFVIIY